MTYSEYEAFGVGDWSGLESSDQDLTTNQVVRSAPGTGEDIWSLWIDLGGEA